MSDISVIKGESVAISHKPKGPIFKTGNEISSVPSEIPKLTPMPKAKEILEIKASESSVSPSSEPPPELVKKGVETSTIDLKEVSGPPPLVSVSSLILPPLTKASEAPLIEEGIENIRNGTKTLPDSYRVSKVKPDSENSNRCPYLVIDKIVPPDWDNHWIAEMDSSIGKIGWGNSEVTREDKISGVRLYFYENEMDPSSTTLDNGSCRWPIESLSRVKHNKEGGYAVITPAHGSSIDEKNPPLLQVKTKPNPLINLVMLGRQESSEEIEFLGITPSIEGFSKACCSSVKSVVVRCDGAEEGLAEGSLVKNEISPEAMKLGVVAIYTLSINVSEVRENTHHPTISEHYFNSEEIYKWVLVAQPTYNPAPLNLNQLFDVI